MHIKACVVQFYHFLVVCTCVRMLEMRHVILALKKTGTNLLSNMPLNMGNLLQVFSIVSLDPVNQLIPSCTLESLGFG